MEASPRTEGRNCVKSCGLCSRCVWSLFYSLARGLPADTLKGKGCSTYGKDLNLSWTTHNTSLKSVSTIFSCKGSESDALYGVHSHYCLSLTHFRMS
jgi:hypothetical protein